MKIINAIIVTGALVLALGTPALIAATAIMAGEGRIKASTHVFCHDEMVCTPIYGCRWVTICN